MSFISLVSMIFLILQVLFQIQVEAYVNAHDGLLIESIYNQTSEYWKPALVFGTDYCTAPRIRCDSSGRVVELSLSELKISGTIPTEVTELTGLISLRLDDNQFKGTIPDLVKLKNLAYLLLHNNKLEGTIPETIGELTRLYQLRLDNNQISGTIPTEIGQLTLLREIRLAKNKIEGTIPTELATLNILSLLDLTRNRITGSIPAQVLNLQKAQTIDLSYNLLNGTISADIPTTSVIVMIDFSNNQLSGTIPSTISNIQTLRQLHLYNNQLTGTIPVELKSHSNTLTSLKLLGTNKFCPLENYISWAIETDYDSNYQCDICSSTNPCSNQGKCSASKGTFICDCEGTGYFGRTCNSETPDCTPSKWFTVNNCP